MNRVIYILIAVLSLVATEASAHVDKRDVRKGNRDYRKENYKEAEIEYRKAIVKDSLSVAANYNLAADLYRQNNPQEAQKVLDRIKEVAPATENAADYYYNVGDVAIANQDWQTAVTAFEESLLRNPGDLNAKENYIYAKKKLEDQQNQQNQQQNDQNQDQNQDNQDQNNDQNQDKNDQNDDQQDQNQDQQDQNNDQNNDQNKNQDQQQNQQPKITPQAAQQMLQAIQAKEKETQEKVNKEKAQALQSRQKERNW